MKAKTQILFIAIVGAYFLLNGFIPRKHFNPWQIYAIELQEQGWSKKASEHIAKVEFKIIPEDSIYIGYMED